MSAMLRTHLKSRPIAPIYRAAKQADRVCEVALKLMVVIDYSLEKSNLYPKILEQPKLLDNLLRFKSFEFFQLYEYKMRKSSFGQTLLECQCCGFVGLYNTTLEHMVVNHDRHCSTEECLWCCKVDIREHVETNTLEKCYRDYLIDHQLVPNLPVYEVIEAFYMRLRLLAEDLGVKTIRSSNYRARLSVGRETIMLNDADKDDVYHEVIVQKPALRIKPIKKDRLDEFVQEALRYFYGDEKEPQTPKMQPPSPQLPLHQQQHQQRQNNQQQQPLIMAMPQMPQMPPMPQMLPMPQMVPMPPMQNAQADPWGDIMNLANHMTVALQNMRNDGIRTRALIDIQRIILNYSAQDLQLQINNANNNN